MMKMMTEKFPGNFCAFNNVQELAFAIDKAARAENRGMRSLQALDAELISSSLKMLSCWLS